MIVTAATRGDLVALGNVMVARLGDGVQVERFRRGSFGEQLMHVDIDLDLVLAHEEKEQGMKYFRRHNDLGEEYVEGGFKMRVIWPDATVAYLNTTTEGEVVAVTSTPDIVADRLPALEEAVENYRAHKKIREDDPDTPRVKTLDYIIDIKGEITVEPWSHRRELVGVGVDPDEM